MYSSSKVGELIKKYRRRSELSQFDLELLINAATGSLSRIEMGRVNPSKETLYKIIQVLDLTPIESIELFGLNKTYFLNIVNLTQHLNHQEKLDDLLSCAADEIVKCMNLVGCSIYIKEGNKLRITTISTNKASMKAVNLLPKPITYIKHDLTTHRKNLVVKSYLENKVYITDQVNDLTTPLIPKFVAKKAQQIAAVKSLIVMPLSNSTQKFGAIVFAKQFKDDFAAEREFLDAIVKNLTENLAKIAF